MSFVYIIYLVFLKLFTDVSPQGWTSVMVSIFFVGGIQLTVLGIIGAYIGRIYDEVKHRPLYLVKRAIGFDNPDGQDEQD